MGKRVKYSTHVPAHIKQFLDQVILAYPAEWTLIEVADESYRRHRTGRFHRPVQASRFLAEWGLFKLAISSLVKAEHWGYLAPLEPRSFDDLLYVKLGHILRAADGASPTWRSDKKQRVAAIEQLDAAAKTILNYLSAASGLNISLQDVGDRYEIIQPLVVASEALEEQAMFVGHRESIAAKASGSDPLLAMAESMRTSYSSPTLAHYLQTFRAKLSRMQAEGMSSGGSFGAYPRRKDALRRAVIIDFAHAMLSDATRSAGTLSKVIEVACIAWFGDAPTRKHIDDLIRPVRVFAIEAAAQRDEEVRIGRLILGGNLPMKKAKISGGLRPRDK